jgi:hypothetical protein
LLDNLKSDTYRVHVGTNFGERLEAEGSLESGKRASSRGIELLRDFSRSSLTGLHHIYSTTGFFAVSGSCWLLFISCLIRDVMMSFLLEMDYHGFLHCLRT